MIIGDYLDASADAQNEVFGVTSLSVAVPEPGTLGCVAAAFLGWAVIGRRRKREQVVEGSE